MTARLAQELLLWQRHTSLWQENPPVCNDDGVFTRDPECDKAGREEKDEFLQIRAGKHSGVIRGELECVAHFRERDKDVSRRIRKQEGQYEIAEDVHQNDMVNRFIVVGVTEDSKNCDSKNRIRERKRSGEISRGRQFVVRNSRESEAGNEEYSYKQIRR
jgi:hypothetical protein